MPLLTRLRLKWLWYRHMWPTLWAHKPLCDRFRGDVIRLGPVRLCRSCFLVYTGLFLTGAVLFASRTPAAIMVPAPLLLLIALTAALSVPPLYRHMPRPARDILRFAIGGLVAASLYVLVTASWVIGAGGLLLLFAAWRILLRWRVAPRRDLCGGCPELDGPGICPGYAPQADRFRAYDQEATALLQATGFVPGLGKTRG